MPKTALYNMEGKQVGEVELSESIFAAPVHTAAMHLVVALHPGQPAPGHPVRPYRVTKFGAAAVKYTARRAQAAHAITATALRSSPTAAWCSHPKPRDYVIKVPKKVRRLAFKSALTSKLQAEEIIVVDELKLKEAKTKQMVAFLKGFDLHNTTLLVLPGREETVLRASGNIPKLQTLYVNTLNVYDILKAGKINLTQEALKGGRGGFRMKHPHDVIIRPVLTEASYEGIPDKRYAFVVNINANKTEIKLALEDYLQEY